MLHRLPRSATICNDVNHETLTEMEGGPTNSLPPPHFFSRSYYEVSESCRPLSPEEPRALGRALGVPVME